MSSPSSARPMSSWETWIDELPPVDGVRRGALPALRAQAGRGRAAVHVDARAPRHARRPADQVPAGPQALGGAGRALPGPGAAETPDRERYAPRRRDPRADAGRSRGRRDLLRDVLQGA